MKALFFNFSKFIIGLCIYSSTLDAQEKYSQKEYSIVLLAPEGQELKTMQTLKVDGRGMNNSGYAWGSISSAGGIGRPFVYHKDIGFNFIDLPSNFSSDYLFKHIAGVNSQGIAVGIYESPFYHERGVFIYDVKEKKSFDLMQNFDVGQTKKFSIDAMIVESLTITDENKIFFRIRRQFDPNDTYIYDLNEKTVPPKLFDFIPVQINARGQMIGGSMLYPSSPQFFDPQTGFYKLDIPDEVNPWWAKPQAISDNGLVVGKGRGRYTDQQVFLWNQEEGLTLLDIDDRNSDKYMGICTVLGISNINDKGEFLGVKYVGRGPDTYAFIFTKDKEIIDLGLNKENVAHSINNHSQVVGQSKQRAFIWDIKHGRRDLTKLLTNGEGWKVLEAAYQINDDGYIFGVGNYYGNLQYYMLIPMDGHG